MESRALTPDSASSAQQETSANLILGYGTDPFGG